MTDPAEQLLRETLAADAVGAPTAPDLARDVVAAARAHRSRRLAIAGSALAVAMLAGAATAWGLAGGGTVARPDDAATPTPTGTPTPVPSPSGPALEYRGVFVPVPAELLEPGAYRCGTAVNDAAYVDDPALPVELCAVVDPHPERLTEVVLEPTDGSIDGGASTVVLDDGRTQVVVDVPDHHVRLRVLSPDPERAAGLAAGLQVVDSPDGCTLRAPAPLVPDHGRSGQASVPAGVTPTVVCGYRGGWLAESVTLGDEEAARVGSALAGLPAFVDSVWGSPSGDPEDAPGSLWLVALSDGGSVRVHGGKASVVVDEQGRRALLGDELGGLLWDLASGPAWWNAGTAR